MNLNAPEGMPLAKGHKAGTKVAKHWMYCSLCSLWKHFVLSVFKKYGFYSEGIPSGEMPYCSSRIAELGMIAALFS